MIERRRSRSVRRSDTLDEQRHGRTSGSIKCHARQGYEGWSRPISQPAYTPESSRRGSLQSRSIRMERIRSDARAPLIYRRARNLHAVQPLVWHAKLDSAVRYRGISGFRDAIDSVLERRRSGFKLGLHCGNAVRTSRGAYPLTDRGARRSAFKQSV